MTSCRPCRVLLKLTLFLCSATVASRLEFHLVAPWSSVPSRRRASWSALPSVLSLRSDPFRASSPHWRWCSPSSRRGGWLAGLSFFLMGAGPIVWVVSTTTLRQTVTPNHLLGRVSAINSLAYGARPVGAGLGAVIGAFSGTEGLSDHPGRRIFGAGRGNPALAGHAAGQRQHLLRNKSRQAEQWGRNAKQLSRENCVQATCPVRDQTAKNSH